MIGKFKITRTSSSGNKAVMDFFYKYRQVEITDGTTHDAMDIQTDWSAEIYLAQLVLDAGGATTGSTTVAFDSPSSGAYQLQVIARKGSGNTATYASTGNDVLVFQEIRA